MREILYASAEDRIIIREKCMKYMVIIMFAVVAAFSAGKTKSIVEIYGHLNVEGQYIVNEAGDPIALPGLSLFWSDNSEKFYNESVIQYFVENWNVTVFRAAMAAGPDQGYIADPETEKQKIVDVVEACIKLGVYVIIDWHDHHGEDHQAEAVAFFKEMATAYGEYPNVMYEIYNEPPGDISYGGVIKPYADAVVGAIREIDPDNIIHVSSPFWSQKPEEAFSNPPQPSNNQVYSLHFYVNTHGEGLRSSIKTNMDNGVPIFANEWGIWGSLRDPQNLEDEFDNWVSALRDNKVSFTYWSINDKLEECKTTAGPGTCSQGWSDNAQFDYNFESMLKPDTDGDAAQWSDADFSGVGLKMKSVLLDAYDALDTLPEFQEDSGVVGESSSVEVSSSEVSSSSSELLSSSETVSSSQVESSSSEESSSEGVSSSEEELSLSSSEIESSSEKDENTAPLFSGVDVADFNASTFVQSIEIYNFMGQHITTLSSMTFGESESIVANLKLQPGSYYLRYNGSFSSQARVMVQP